MCADHSYPKHGSDHACKASGPHPHLNFRRPGLMLDWHQYVLYSVLNAPRPAAPHSTHSLKAVACALEGIKLVRTLTPWARWLHTVKALEAQLPLKCWLLRRTCTARTAQPRASYTKDLQILCRAALAKRITRIRQSGASYPRPSSSSCWSPKPSPCRSA